MSRTDVILAAIDAGLQHAGDNSYGENPDWSTTIPAPRCWRCLGSTVEHAEQVCDACRAWMCGDCDDDPAALLNQLAYYSTTVQRQNACAAGLHGGARIWGDGVRRCSCGAVVP